MATLSTKFSHGIGIVVIESRHVTEHEATCLLVMTCVGAKVEPAAVHYSQIRTLGMQQQRCSVFCILIVLACVTVQVSGQGFG